MIMSKYTLKNGIEVDVLCFEPSFQKNDWGSMYYGIDQSDADGLERLLEWGPNGNCLYASKYFNIAGDYLRRLPWNNQGPMEIDKFAKLEEWDMISFSRMKEEKELLQTKVKFINPILSLELK
jgi:hypothetical protein